MLVANFTAYGKYTVDSVTQWDKDRVLQILGVEVEDPVLHFTNSDMEKSIERTGTYADGKITVTIPNSVLQVALPVLVYIGMYEDNEFKVVEKMRIPVNPKNKPLDYVLEATDTEVYSFNETLNAVENALEDLVDAKDEIIENFGDEGLAHKTEIVSVDKWVLNSSDVSKLKGGSEMAPIDDTSHADAILNADTIVIETHKNGELVRAVLNKRSNSTANNAGFESSEMWISNDNVFIDCYHTSIHKTTMSVHMGMWYTKVKFNASSTPELTSDRLPIFTSETTDITVYAYTYPKP